MLVTKTKIGNHSNQKEKVMSLAQRELGNIFRIDKEKEMSNKHIEIIRFDAGKIAVREYLNATPLSHTPTYQPAIIKSLPILQFFFII